MKSNLHFLHRFHSPEPATATKAMKGNRLFLLLFSVNGSTGSTADSREQTKPSPGSTSGPPEILSLLLLHNKKQTESFSVPSQRLWIAIKAAGFSFPENSHLSLGKENLKLCLHSDRKEKLIHPSHQQHLYSRTSPNGQSQSRKDLQSSAFEGALRLQN